MRDKKLKKARLRAMKRLGLNVAPGRRTKLADGWYRMRRGKLVRIPDEWLGRPAARCEEGLRWRTYKLSVTRPSKMGTKKQRRRHGLKDWGRVPRERQRWDSAGDRITHSGRMRHPRNRTPRHLSRRHRRDVEDGVW